LSGHVAVGPDDPAVLGVANALMAGGATDLHAGLTTGYQLAEDHYRPEGINRVVLVSDGLANVGVTDEHFIAEKAEDENREGIYLVGVGVGYGYNDTLMNTVTDAGNGAYVFIDTTDEAHKMFGGRFDEVMEVSARSLQLKVTMPWYFSMLQFHGEQYGTDPKKVKPQHLAPGDAMVFHQVLRACDASQLDPADNLSFSASWVEPVTFIDRTATVETTLGELLAGADDQLARGRAIVAYAEALKAIPYLSHPARLVAIDDALALVAAANDSSDPELTEIAQLLAAYRQAPGI
jgi:Ca-activated chloride channel family protein